MSKRESLTPAEEMTREMQAEWFIPGAVMSDRESLFASLREACEGWPTPNRYTAALDEVEKELVDARAMLALCAANHAAADLAQELECLKASAREVIEYVGCLMPDECGGMHGKCRVCHLRFYLEDKDLVD
jgi:hypothetical protein